MIIKIAEYEALGSKKQQQERNVSFRGDA